MKDLAFVYLSQRILCDDKQLRQGALIIDFGIVGFSNPKLCRPRERRYHAPRVASGSELQRKRLCFNYSPGLQSRLKCDRNEPCANCTSRNKECTYEFVARRRMSSWSQEEGSRFENRIRRLEELISVAAAPNARVNGATPATKDAIVQDAATEMNAHDMSESVSVRQSERSDLRPGRMTNDSNETAYVAGTHWAAIYDEVSNAFTRRWK